MKKKKDFLKQFFKERKKVGAVSPSSKFLAKKMLENIDFSKTKTLVELGPGTGVFTRKIIKKMAPDAKLLIFELHTPFYKQLKTEFKDDKRVILIHDNAERINYYFKKHELETTDAVISSLPLANFKKDTIKSILQNMHDSLTENGLYIQFQYSLKSKKQLESVFSDISVKFTPRNIPPAFIYTCRKNKSNS